MVISSLIVETIPTLTEHAAQELSCIDGVEVHEITDEKIVVTIETSTLDSSHAIASSFITLSGVTGVNLVYANFEDDPSLQGIVEK